MKTVIFKDFVEWVMKQPEDRPVDMSEIHNHSECGCLMVQYGKEVLNLECPFRCGYDNWTTNFEEGSS